jgi:hypothetical protein
MKDYKVLSNNANSDEACALRWVKIVLSMLIFHPSIPKYQPYENIFAFHPLIQGILWRYL